MKKLNVVMVLLLVVVSFFIGRYYGDPNDRMIFGDTGLPIKIMRALLTKNSLRQRR
jgi:hypothetical protein